MDVTVNPVDSVTAMVSVLPDQDKRMRRSADTVGLPESTPAASLTGPTGLLFGLLAAAAGAPPFTATWSVLEATTAPLA